MTLLNLTPSSTYFTPFLMDNIVLYYSTTASNLGVLFDSTISFFLILLPSINMYIIIFLELEKYENKLLCMLLKL